MIVLHHLISSDFLAPDFYKALPASIVWFDA